MNRLLFWSFIAVLFACSMNHADNSDLLREFYLKEKPDGSFEKFDKVVVISEKTTCLNCTNWFATKLADSLNISEILYIVSGSGAKIDISPYVDEEQDNLILDFNSYFDKIGPLKGSGIIYLDYSGQITSTTTERTYLKEEYGITFDEK